MTTVGPDGGGGATGGDLGDQLEPVRLALLDDAGREARALLALAATEADEVVGRARHDAAAEVERAERRVEAARRARAERDVARARAEADREVLAVRAELRRELTAAARRATTALRHHPRYQELLDRLEALARSQLGDRATVERDPDPDGGVVATAGHRRVDYTLASLADRSLADLADEVAAPWN